MREERFVVPIESGELHGHRAPSDAPAALLLHGGAAVPDYMGSCAEELRDLFSTYRYTQRGTPPSSGGPPYTVESHMEDALAVLDAFGVDRAWAVGHSWGGHLALHLLVNHPGRLLGVICVDPLGAHAEIFGEYEANLGRAMGAQAAAEVVRIEALRREGRATEDDLVARFALVWPHYFVDPERAPPGPGTVGVEASTGTNASLSEHFRAGTLARRLPGAALPALFIHGELDPLPLRTSVETAALIPGARVEVVPGAGHFPWLEQPGEVRRRVEAFLA